MAEAISGDYSLSSVDPEGNREERHRARSRAVSMIFLEMDEGGPAQQITAGIGDARQHLITGQQGPPVRRIPLGANR